MPCDIPSIDMLSYHPYPQPFYSSLTNPTSSVDSTRSRPWTLIHFGFLPPLPPLKFYSRQQLSLIPACIFTPSTPREVSTGLQIVKTYDCQFAVRSGGHGIPPGWSNSDGGVNINLDTLNEVELLEVGITRVGPGANWGQVYEVLDPLNISVVGGRSAEVGVGRFILGGKC
jgi:FAD/FMN-containing dehydrogenase